MIDGPENYYEILDVPPNASPAEIREAYIRAKTTYSRDSVALYTLVDTSERDEILDRIEKAYEVLANPERRREYDRGFDQIASVGMGGGAGATAWHRHAGGANSKVVSIDRVPPMEKVEDEESILVAPVTDFTSSTPPAFHPAPPAPAPHLVDRPAAAAPVSSSPVLHRVPEAPEIDIEIQAETEWSGTFLRRVREARGISIEEVTQATKITRPYLMALEEENFSKLPAPVYIRGFVVQMARLLRLPQQTVSNAYMIRCQKLCPEKFK